MLRHGPTVWGVAVTSNTPMFGRFYGAQGGRIHELQSGRLIQHRGASGRTIETIAEDVSSVTSAGERVFLDRANVGPYEVLHP